MIEKAAALELARKYVAALERPTDDELVIWDEQTEEVPVGWVYFFQTRSFIETGDVDRRIVGNGPLLVDRRDGSLHVFDTASHWTKHVEDYQSAHGDISPRADASGSAV